jgi:hypothetical protein
MSEPNEPTEETEYEDEQYLWKKVNEEVGKSWIVFKKPKPYIAGWVMQHEDGTWVARTERGVRGEFETDEDAKAFLKLLLASNS